MVDVEITRLQSIHRMGTVSNNNTHYQTYIIIPHTDIDLGTWKFLKKHSAVMRIGRVLFSMRFVLG